MECIPYSRFAAPISGGTAPFATPHAVISPILYFFARFALARRVLFRLVSMMSERLGVRWLVQCDKLISDYEISRYNETEMDQLDSVPPYPPWGLRTGSRDMFTGSADFVRLFDGTSGEVHPLPCRRPVPVAQSGAIFSRIQRESWSPWCCWSRRNPAPRDASVGEIRPMSKSAVTGRAAAAGDEIGPRNEPTRPRLVVLVGSWFCAGPAETRWPLWRPAAEPMFAKL